MGRTEPGPRGAFRFDIGEGLRFLWNQQILFGIMGVLSLTLFGMMPVLADKAIAAADAGS
jgi:hypothetical protein